MWVGINGSFNCSSPDALLLKVAGFTLPTFWWEISAELRQKIIKPDPDDDLAADRLKNAAAIKKLCIFDAFEILKRIEEEREALEENNINTKVDTKQGFAERRSK